MKSISIRDWQTDEDGRDYNIVICDGYESIKIGATDFIKAHKILINVGNILSILEVDCVPKSEVPHYPFCDDYTCVTTKPTLWHDARLTSKKTSNIEVIK